MAEEGIVYTTGSDIVYDFFCELCIEDGRHVEAEGYCQDCGEYLCGSCYGGHRKSRPTRHHVLQDKDSMPKDTPLSPDRVSRDITTTCKRHKGEPLKYYCRSHNDLGCASCFVTGHRGCMDIENIMDASENIFESREHQYIISKVQSLKQLSQDIKAHARDNNTVSQKCCNDVVSAVKNQKKEAIRRLDDLEGNIVRLAQLMNSENEEKMASVVEQSEALSETIQQMLSKLEHLQLSKQVCELYIAIKQIGSGAAEIHGRLYHLKRTNVVGKFMFEPNVDVLNHMPSYPYALGKIIHTVQITRAADINVGAACITGSAVFSNSRLVLTDWNIWEVKLVNTSTHKLLSRLSVTSEPHDVANISDNQAAITIPNKKIILVVEVTDKLKGLREIRVSGKCRGVAYSKERLFVTFVSKPPRLEILDMLGIRIRSIVYSSEGSMQILFKMPEYVCVSPDGGTIYVSDTSLDTVTSLACYGALKDEYGDGKLEGPQKVCTDHRGNVYICGCFSTTVHMVTAGCRKVKVILTEKDGLGGKVYSVSHCQETDRLFVGTDSKMLKVYQLA